MSREQLMSIWNELCKVNEDNQTQDNIDRELELSSLLEENLPFKDDAEHEHWVDVFTSYKFFEDIEELTLNIIRRSKC